MPRSRHRRRVGGEGKRSDSLSRSLTGRRMPNDPPARHGAHYGLKAPTADAILTRKGAFAGKGRCPARTGGGAGLRQSRSRVQRTSPLSNPALALCSSDGRLAVRHQPDPCLCGAYRRGRRCTDEPHAARRDCSGAANRRGECAIREARHVAARETAILHRSPGVG